MIIKTFRYIILVVFFTSCATKSHTSNEINKQCDENLKFKVEFFKNIKVIEDYMKIESTINNLEEYEKVITDENIKSFESSLKFISKYTYVSFESIANYARIYPIGVFEKDKDGWLKWYEENKCYNIQFK